VTTIRGFEARLAEFFLLCVRSRRQRVKDRRRRRHCSGEDAIEHDGVDVDVQIQRTPEALDDGDRPALAILRPARIRPNTIRTKTASTSRHSAVLCGRLSMSGSLF